LGNSVGVAPARARDDDDDDDGGAKRSEAVVL
jgi:hypothetical protein